MIKYIGSKRALIPVIVDLVTRVMSSTRSRTALDLFSGSARVGHALKSLGLFVTASDINNYSYVLAKALVEADSRDYSRELVVPILEYLSTLPPKRGWFTETYCEAARFFQPKNGARIESIREAIEIEFSHDPLLKAVLLTSLMIAADKVDSTTGVQMAYLKRWAPRSYHDLSLEYPPLLPGKGKAVLGDALEVVESLEADIVYIDPPYNHHSYLANYHIWETLVLWDRPSVYGRANKREDVRTRKSPFNSKKKAKDAIKQVIEKSRSKHLIVSFSNEGFVPVEYIEGLLKEWGYLVKIERVHRRYVGSLIGIYNPRGERVGKVSHTYNHEYIFFASKELSAYRAVLPLGRPVSS